MGDNPAADAPDQLIELPNYVITRYRGDDRRVVVAFASAGFWGLGEPLEEFKATLSGLGVATVFVRSRSALWFNNPDARYMLDLVDNLTAGFEHCGTLGESMGACGALLFASACPRVSRILAFSPQFSVMPPFVDFDPRYRRIGNEIENHRWQDFAFDGLQHKTTLLFGNTEVCDLPHSAMFLSHGFEPIRLSEAGHEIGRYLKRDAGTNMLRPLMARFCDFEASFGRSAVIEVLGTLVSQVPPPHLPAAHAQQVSVPPGVDVALGKRAWQSSTSAWSIGSAEEDASRAVSPLFDPDFSFCTGEEQSPWWMVDLGADHEIDEIWIYNRSANAARLSSFFVAVSADRDTWARAYAGTATEETAHAVIVCRLEEPMVGQYVVIAKEGFGWLHLSRVRVFGRPIASGASTK